MAKQIYIDENGNEILLSGTINSADMLPISAGSSTMTDDAIDALKTKPIAFTAESGVTPVYISASKTDKLVTISGEIRFSGNANTWTNLGSIAYPPNVSQIGVPAISTANGTLMGILQVQSTGNVRIYPTSNVTNGACGFTTSYMTT